jgi:2-phospho-L-lactate guanylyltransferase
MTHAVLPIKRFDAAKQRLAPSLEPAQRRELAEAMVADVLQALAQVTGLAEVIVVSGEPAVAPLAAATGASLVEDRADAAQRACSWSPATAPRSTPRRSLSC